MYRSVQHKVVSLYICKNRTLHIFKYTVGVTHIGSRHPMCSKGQSNKIFASDFFRYLQTFEFCFEFEEVFAILYYLL
jgi:hypothetical protein